MQDDITPKSAPILLHYSETGKDVLNELPWTKLGVQAVYWVNYRLSLLLKWRYQNWQVEFDMRVHDFSQEERWIENIKIFHALKNIPLEIYWLRSFSKSISEKNIYIQTLLKIQFLIISYFYHECLWEKRKKQKKQKKTIWSSWRGLLLARLGIDISDFAWHQ